MGLGANFGTWGRLEANRVNFVGSSVDVGEARLEPHGGLAIKLGVNLLVKPSIHRGKLFAVKATGNQLKRIFKEVTLSRLIKGVKSDHVRVLGKAGGGSSPKIDKLVLHTLVVVVEGTEQVPRLSRVVILTEISCLAISDEVIIILVNFIAIVLHVSALAKGIKEGLQPSINRIVDTTSISG